MSMAIILEKADRIENIINIPDPGMPYNPL